MYIENLVPFAEGFTVEEDSSREGLNYPEFAPRQNVIRWDGVLYTSTLRILLYRAQKMGEMDSLPTGIELASDLIDGALEPGYIPFAIEALLLRGQMYAALGEHKPRYDGYAHAIQLGQPEGLISIYLERGPLIREALAKMLNRNRFGSLQSGYVERILAAFAKTGAKLEGEPTVNIPFLPERELDVLRLMVEGLKYGEIADQLYISLNTVRSHVKSVYGKFGVNNRTKAIEQAHKLGLL
jgi:LuxR family maltose regulon positive regulatory protein